MNTKVFIACVLASCVEAAREQLLERSSNTPAARKWGRDNDRRLHGLIESSDEDEDEDEDEDDEDTETGTNIFSAMALNTAHPEDADLEHVTYFVLSQMGAAWTYALLEQPATGVDRLDILLIYREEQATAEDYAFNAQLSDGLPSYFDGYELHGSCICGNGEITVVQIQYDEIDPMHRVGVVVHEYYHVIQFHYCGEPPSLMFLSEGAATVTEHLFNHWWFGGGNGAAHASYASTGGNKLDDAIRWVTDTGYVFSDADNTYPSTMNYRAEVVMVLQLIEDYGASYVLHEFLTSGACDLRAAGGDEEGFVAAFPKYDSLADFYDSLNANRALGDGGSFPTLSHIDYAEIYDLFGNDLCSDACPLANNGVCDASCLYGSDCTDCGTTTLPVAASGGAGYAFPVTFAEQWVGEQPDACAGLKRKRCKSNKKSCSWSNKTCKSKSTGICAGLKKKKCKKTDGCNYKKKTCSASCAGLSKRKCKKTDGCKYKSKKAKCSSRNTL